MAVWGFDARDWIRGEKPWGQFLTYCSKLANTAGTDLRAAQLNDDRFLAEVEQLYELQRRGPQQPYRPPLEGFSAEVEAIYAVSDDIRLLIRAMTASEIDFRERPESPLDRIKKRKKQLTLSRIEALLNEEVS